MKEWLSKVWTWIKPKLAALFTLTCKTIAKKVLDVLNDAELQRMAYACVETVAKSGLKGNEAFDTAFAALTSALKDKGEDLADNVKDTLIQNAYCVFKNQE